MIPVNPQAEALNGLIRSGHPVIESLLSEKGRSIFFPKKGIISQSQEAKDLPINATAGIGLNDDGSPMRLPSIASKILLDPVKVFPYAPSYGVMPLRQAWRDQIYKKNPSLKATISLPVVTSGLTHGLSMAGYLFLNPGDTLILPNIYWGNYRLVFQQNYGAQFKTYDPFDKGGYYLAGLNQALQENSGKQMVLLNFPHNPTGYSLTEKEGDQICDVLLASAERGNRLIVLLDDAYFGLVYEKGILKESLFARLADLHQNILAVKADAVTKEDYAWGFRIGFLTYASKGANAEVLKALEDKTGGAVRSNISNCCHLSQSLILEALITNDYDKEKEEKRALLNVRYEKVKTVLAEHGDRYSAAFTALPYNSGYFMCLKLREDLDAEEVRTTLIKEHRIGTIATDGLIRIAFSAVPTDRIQDIFEALFQVTRKRP